MQDCVRPCRAGPGRTHVKTHADLIRPAEVDVLLGDAGKAKTRAGLDAGDLAGSDMIAEMVEADLVRHRARLARLRAPSHAAADPGHGCDRIRWARIYCQCWQAAFPGAVIIAGQLRCHGSRLLCWLPSRRPRPMPAFTWRPLPRSPRRSRIRTAAWRVNLHGTLGLARALMTAAPGIAPSCFRPRPMPMAAASRSGTPVTEATALAPMNTLWRHQGCGGPGAGSAGWAGAACDPGAPVQPYRSAGKAPAFVVAAFRAPGGADRSRAAAAGAASGRTGPAAGFPGRAGRLRGLCAMPGPGGWPCRLVTILNIASGTARRVGDVLQDLLADCWRKRHG